jgi:hypothetical protein
MSGDYHKNIAISEDDQKAITAMLEGKADLPPLTRKADENKFIGIGTKVHPVGYRMELYGLVTRIKRDQIEVTFNHLKNKGGKPTKKWFKISMICRFEDRANVYADAEKKLNLNVI